VSNRGRRIDSINQLPRYRVPCQVLHEEIERDHREGREDE
jgi:hypothetical protein